MPQRKQLTQDIEELKHAMMNSSNTKLLSKLRSMIFLNCCFAVLMAMA